MKIALPDRPVICLSGDGSAMYTIQSLWTAARYKIGVVFVIFNNTSYRILKQRLFAQRGYAAQLDTYVGMELNNPAIDYVGLARSLGLEAEKAKSVHDATDLIAKAIGGRKPNADRGADRARVQISKRGKSDNPRNAAMPEQLLPTTVVGSYPQPEWLVDLSVLKSQTVPRVRLQGDVARGRAISRTGAGRRDPDRDPRHGARRHRHHHRRRDAARELLQPLRDRARRHRHRHARGW